MASGTGYIVEWFVNDIGGIIHVCDGENLVGEDVAFLFDECSNQLKTILEEGDIHEEVDCPPPTGAISVTFDFDITNGEDLARHVQLD